MNLENWSSWKSCYCRKSSLNFIVYIHKTLRTPSLSSCKIHFLLSISNADFQLGLIYSPICSLFQVLSVLFSCQKNMSRIFPVCLILILPALSPHPAIFSFFFSISHCMIFEAEILYFKIFAFIKHYIDSSQMKKGQLTV